MEALRPSKIIDFGNARRKRPAEYRTGFSAFGMTAAPPIEQRAREKESAQAPTSNRKISFTFLFCAVCIATYPFGSIQMGAIVLRQRRRGQGPVNFRLHHRAFGIILDHFKDPLGWTRLIQTFDEITNDFLAVL